MKLVTYTSGRDTRLGAMLDDKTVVDLNRASGGNLPADMIAFLNAGDEAMRAARRAMEAARAAGNAGASATGVVFSLEAPGTRLEAPVPRPGKVLAIGLNYRDHAEETSAEIPKRPVVFAKMPTCITGPGAPGHLPKVSSALDWEGELCFVIGTRGRHIAEADAMSHVAGFCNGNDLSVRDWQFHSPTWMMGKGFDTHGPIGPWLVTPDEIPDVNNLDVKTWVNDELVQNSNTKHLIFGVGAIIEYLSAAFTLEPGDIVFTGTPAGVGVARKPPRYMKAGDVVRVEISGLGVLENPVIDEP
jgi:2-keto-4-pentenoate hydratase/2-oxohepta-3-ene-1,7-dioic acid hydratase in catechol pathway